MILEVTSHALRLERVNSLLFDGGLLAAIMLVSTPTSIGRMKTTSKRNACSCPGSQRTHHSPTMPTILPRRLATEPHQATGRHRHSPWHEHDKGRDAQGIRPIGFTLEGRNTDLQLYDILLDGKERHSASVARRCRRNQVFGCTARCSAAVICATWHWH